MAPQESQEHWKTFFKHLCERGLKPQLVELVVSDGTTGLPNVLEQYLPTAEHQRCVTHKDFKVRLRLVTRTLGFRL